MKDNNFLYRIIDEDTGLYLGGKLDGHWHLSDKDYRTFTSLGACKSFLTKMRKNYNSGIRPVGIRTYPVEINPNNLKIAQFSLVLTKIL